MPRRAEIQPRPIDADPVYERQLVTQLTNRVMLDGKKSVAEAIVYRALEKVGERTGRPPVEVLDQAVKTVTPVLEVRSRRVGGANYQVPVEVPQRRGRTLALRWLVTFARDAAREAHERQARRRDPRRARTSRAARSSARTTCTGWRRPTRRSRTTAGNGEIWQSRRQGSRSTASATSGSWPTSMRARPRRRSGSSTTPAAPTRWARCTRAPRRWTGWRRSRSAASRSRRRRRRRSGATIASTLSIRPGTWTLRSRSSAACASSTARSPSSTPSRASSRSPRRSGGRPTSTRSRGSRSSTRWTAPARTSSPPSSRCATASARTPCRSRSRSARRTHHRGVVDLVEMRAIVYEDDLGAGVRGQRDPAGAAEQAQEYHHQLIDASPTYDDEVLETYLEDENSVTPEMIRRALRAGTLADEITPVLLGSAFKNKGVQPLLDAVVDYLPSPLDVPPMMGLDPKSGDEVDARAVARGAVLGARLQGHVRPVRRQAHLLPRLLRASQGRRPRGQHDDRQDRAHRPHPADAREPPRGARRDRRGRHRRRRRPQVDDDGRHARGRDARRSSSSR